MTNFNFVCRENEIDEVISSLTSHALVILRSENNSGLTHFLKKIMRLLWTENSTCFYIDSESKQSVSKQIIGQVANLSKNDSSDQNKVAKLLRKSDKGNLVFSVVSSCLYALDTIPALPGIGTIANSLITSIKSTIDADKEHLDDFKTEKAVAQFFEVLSQKEKKQVFLLFDKPEKLSSDEHPFISLLIERFQVHSLFAFNNNSFLDESEMFSKITSTKNSIEHRISRVSNEFKRPDNQLIESLFQYYNKELYPETIKFFEGQGRNIHVIMAYIVGVPMDISKTDETIQYLLKILYVLNCPVSTSTLFHILRAENLRSFEYSDSELHDLCTRAIEQKLIRTHSHAWNKAPVLELNKSCLHSGAINVSFIEKQKIVVDAIQAMDLEIDSLSASMLEFAISHLEHDYTHRKQYILSLVHKQSKERRVSLTYLDKLNYFEKEEELFYICCLYYDKGIYDKPYRLLQTHKNFSRKQNYKILQAMICERLHTDNYVYKLEKLFDHTKDQEKKCLLAAVLFVAYLNSDDAQKYKCFFDENSKYHHKSFQYCLNYHYLLRNITYYIEDIPMAIRNYEKCLDIFKHKDPVNYNRTISNYICYLMRNDFDQLAKSRMGSISKEVAQILDYNDPAYAYLNNNYGIYLMRYSDEDPTAYFTSIPYSTGTTETPYIYAQVNLALYYAKTNPRYALTIMNNVEERVQRTTVPRTKQFYKINRALIEFANGIFPQDLLTELLNQPLRGDINAATVLYNQYVELQETGNQLDVRTFKNLSLPGYLFYRYFEAEKLLSNF